MSTVLVIGDGVAGTAAAWRAAREGAAVTLVAGGAGASLLAPGAVDDRPWESVARAARALGAEMRARALDDGLTAFAEALDLWRLPREGEPLPLLATMAGCLRPARGHDRALLDLGALAGATIAVPRADRVGWDADALAAAWGDDPFARRLEIRFVPLHVSLLRFADEQRISDADLAARHDDSARLGWFADRLRESFARAGKTPRAVLLGPWLGLDSPAASALAERLGIAAGEALAGAGSPAGLRLARARDRLLAGTTIRRVHARVRTLTLGLEPKRGEAKRGEDRRPSLLVEGDDDALRADRVVLACGGLVGGGLRYDPLDIHAGADVPESNAPPFRFSFELVPTSAGRPYFAAGGARIGIASSMFGLDLDLSAWPSPGRPGLLESVGVACDEAGIAAPALAAAGDAVADRPRTMLIAIESGLRAGAWAAGK